MEGSLLYIFVFIGILYSNFTLYIINNIYYFIK